MTVRQQNVDRPNGALMIGTLSGYDWHGSIQQFDTDGSTNSTTIMPGDLVRLNASGFVSKYAAAGAQVIGVCVGVQVDRDVANTEHPGFLPASTVGEVSVAVAADAIMEMQEDGVGSQLTLAEVGRNIEIIDAGGNTTTGVSEMELDSSTHATTATLPLRIHKLVERENNVIGTATLPNARWEVIWNAHYWRNTTAV